MEIERKFVPVKLPDNLESYPHTRIEQGYLCTAPVVRVRRDGDSYYNGAVSCNERASL